MDRWLFRAHAFAAGLLKDRVSGASDSIKSNTASTHLIAHCCVACQSGPPETASSTTKRTPRSRVTGAIASPIGLFCIMKDDAHCMALSAADAADAMAHIDPILTLRPFDRPIV
jgi:hypothetical protein